MSGRQIKLFLVDGTPGGLTTAEITNWTGHVISAPRNKTGELLARDESRRTGVYLLLGEDKEVDDDARCYIGEADVVGDRLRSHNREKDFWDRVVVITSKDANLTKSHVRYLESRLITLANLAGRVTLENGTAPPLPPLPEADMSDMDYFLSQLQIVLPVLGVDAVRVLDETANPAASSTDDSPVFELNFPRSGVLAKGRQIDGEFVVLAGSRIVPRWSATGKAASTRRSYDKYRAQHEALLEDGSISVVDGVGLVTRNIPFKSPSTAGAIALGRSCNGRESWLYPGGNFGRWESRGVE